MRTDNSLKGKRLYEFGPFRLDTGERVICSAGRPLSVAPKAMDLLITLIENRGRIVEREELMREVWGETFVEENNLAFNVSVLRKLFGESPASPSYIETVPRRGYRFIAEVVELTEEAPFKAAKPGQDPTFAKTPPPKPNSRRNRSPLFIATVVAFVGLSAFVATWLFMRQTVVPSFNIKVQQLTTNSAENPVSHSVLSPDGKYLVYGDLSGMRLQEISTGRTHALPKPETLSNDDAWFPAAWLPDGVRMVASSIKAMPNGTVNDSIWLVSVLGGKPLLIRDDGIAQAVSPDGSWIAFTRDRNLDGPTGLLAIPWSPEIWVMGQNGEDARRVVAGDGKSFVRTVQWSPDGKFLAYVAIHFYSKGHPDVPDIETIPLKGGKASVILPDFPPESDFCWLPTGRIIYTRPDPAPANRNTNLWELNVDSKTAKPQSDPRQITNIPGFNMSNLSVSSDGKKLSVDKVLARNDIYIGRLKSDGGLEQPRRLTYDERSNLPFAWTLDSKSVIFTSDRTGVNAIYRQGIDSDLPEMISTGPERVSSPRVTPDGSSIVYVTEQNISFPWESGTVRVMRLAIAGGARKVLMEFPTSDYNLDCPTQPNAQCVFEECLNGEMRSVYFAFDPSTGNRRELFRGAKHVTGFHEWTISPDGTHIAETDEDSIEILSLAGKREHEIHLHGWPYLANVDWSADGKAFWVSHDEPKRTILLKVSLDGHADPLWKMDNFVTTWAKASPDGRYVAIMAGSQNSNAWLLENF